MTGRGCAEFSAHFLEGQHPFCFARHCAILFSPAVPGREAASMKMFLASVFTTFLTIALTLAAMFTLVRATVFVTSIESPLPRAAAIAAEMLLGVVLLLGTVWLATHLAVRIFGKNQPSPSPGGPLA
jgi:hypothetical protein